jgi:tetratricopeptide (TPR) repeat protein
LTSVRLFVQSAQRVQANFALNQTNLPGVLRICALVEGMPLGLELAAAWTEMLSPAEIANEIEKSVDFLAVDWPDVPVRQRSMRAVFDWSWQLLTPTEQQVLRQLAIFRGGFTREAAEQIAGASLRVLTSLVQKSLIRRMGASSPLVGRYDLHELLRQFAADNLHPAAQETAAGTDVPPTIADRHSAYYLNFVAVRERMLTRDQPRQAVEEIQREVDNVRQAWAWAVAHIGQVSLAGAICERLEVSAYALWHFYLITGLFAEGVATFQQASAGIQAALSALSTTETGTETIAQRWQQLLSKLLALEAYLLATHGYHTRVLPLAQQAIAIGSAYGDVAGEIIGLLAVTLAYYHNGAPGEAQAAGERLLQRIHQVPWGNEPAEYYYDVQFMAYICLGAIAINDDQYEQAYSHLTQALQLCQPLGKLRGEMHARLNLANLARWKHNYAAARPDYQQALQLACDLDYRRGEAVARYELADVLRGLGEYSSALEQLARAMSILSEIGDLSRENHVQADVGRLYAYLGDFERARALLDEVLLRSEHFIMLDDKANALLAVATLHQLAGEVSETLHYATRCHQVAREHSNRGYEGSALLYVGNAFADLGRWPEAKAAYINALQLYQQLDTAPMVAEAQAGLARVALAQDDPAAALAWVEKILVIPADHATVGLDEPFQIYLTCYHVLTANNDARNTAILQRGAKELFRYAKNITDSELRRSFFACVPVHQALHQATIASLGAAEASSLNFESH